MDREQFEARLTETRHDLRTPLNHIIGYCEILIEDAETESGDALIPDLKKVQSAGQQLLDLIGSLLSIDHLLGDLSALPEPPASQQPAAQVAIDLKAITLPSDLLTRLYAAVDVHRVADVRACIEEVKALGGESTELAERLDELVRAYDMESIRTLVEALRND